MNFFKFIWSRPKDLLSLIFTHIIAIIGWYALLTGSWFQVNPNWLVIIAILIFNIAPIGMWIKIYQMYNRLH